jgi:3-dehydroshikimate dehydratase
MIQLAAFADEIDPDIHVQIDHCRLNGVSHIELRSVDQINVLDFSAEQRQRIRAAITDAGMGVACIGSPVGKVTIDRPFAEHMDRFKVAVDMALYFQAPLIRVFSYYPADVKNPPPILAHRDEIMERFQKKVEYIFGEKALACLDLMQTINSPRLRSAFDFANFVQAKEKPIESWTSLKPFTTHLHIKDARMSDGAVVVAGAGDGNVEAILVDAINGGYQGFLSLEPHLKVAGHSHGETGPELFKSAVDALKIILNKNKITWAGHPYVPAPGTSK